MPAYLKPIPQPRCSCGRPARVTLVNARNAPLGEFCKPCGKARLTALEWAIAGVQDGDR